MVEGTGLENRQAGNRLVGSNPTLSATFVRSVPSAQPRLTGSRFELCSKLAAVAPRFGSSNRPHVWRALECILELWPFAADNAAPYKAGATMALRTK